MRILSNLAAALVFYMLLLVLAGTSCTRTVRPEYPEEPHVCRADGSYMGADGAKFYAECSARVRP